MSNRRGERHNGSLPSLSLCSRRPIMAPSDKTDRPSTRQVATNRQVALEALALITRSRRRDGGMAGFR